MGICQSHCTEHSWKRSKYQPGKKSIFAENQPNGTQDQDAEQEDEEIDSQVNDDKKRVKPERDLSVDSSAGKDVPCDVAQQSSEPNTSRSFFQELSSDKNIAPTDHQLRPAPAYQYTQRNFHGLEECVNWLLSRISMDLESEFHDVSQGSSVQLELGSSQWIEAASTNNQDKGFVHGIAENPSANQRPVSVESLSSSGLDRGCHCPQCCHIEVNCIHRDSNFASAEDNKEKFGSIEDSKEFSSSLECFDFVHSGMNSDDLPIVQCPNNSNSSGRSHSRSVSPSKATKNGKGEFIQPAP